MRERAKHVHRVTYAPTDGLAYDPEEPSYWDEAALQREVARVFDVCHGCRMCFKYCDASRRCSRCSTTTHDGDVRALTAGRRPAGSWTPASSASCARCSVPYTPRDGHAFQLDFPKLVHRHQAQQARATRAHAARARARQPRRAWAWRAARRRRSPTGMNRNSRAPPVAGEDAGHPPRQAAAGVRAARPSRRGPSRRQADRRRARAPRRCSSRPATCRTTSREIGRDTRRGAASERRRRPLRDAASSCCGMPAWEYGDLEELRRRARRNLDC